MIVTPDLRTWDLLKSDLVRSPGVHASDIYGSLFKKLDPKRYDYGDDDDMNEVLIALGTAWEKHFEFLLDKNGITSYRPGEFLSPEGIAYSPDMLVFNGHARLGEIKLTSMSLDSLPTTEPVNRLDSRFDKYLVQMALYAYWLELRHGWLCICSIRKPYNPELRVLNIEWTQQDLKSNYDMCRNHAIHEGIWPK